MQVEDAVRCLRQEEQPTAAAPQLFPPRGVLHEVQERAAPGELHHQRQPHLLPGRVAGSGIGADGADADDVLVSEFPEGVGLGEEGLCLVAQESFHSHLLPKVFGRNHHAEGTSPKLAPELELPQVDLQSGTHSAFPRNKRRIFVTNIEDQLQKSKQTRLKQYKKYNLIQNRNRWKKSRYI